MNLLEDVFWLLTLVIASDDRAWVGPQAIPPGREETNYSCIDEVFFGVEMALE